YTRTITCKLSCSTPRLVPGKWLRRRWPARETGAASTVPVTSRARPSAVAAHSTTDSRHRMTSPDTDQRETDALLTAVAQRVADVASWPPPRSPELAKLLHNGTLAYGITSDESRIEPLRALFRHCIDNLELEVRLSLYRDLRDRTMEETSSINTLM